MGSARIHSAAIIGLQALPITVEVDISSGMPQFHVVGLPDAAVSESRERVRAAIKFCGFAFPRTHVTVNLAPADIRKQGPYYDLAIALGILCAQGLIVNSRLLENLLVLGELGLDGCIRPVRGTLLAAQRAKLDEQGILVPQINSDEARLVNDLSVYSSPSLGSLVQSIERNELPNAQPQTFAQPPVETALIDMADICGQSHAKRGLEIAAAGGHNVLFVGPPGSGKTLLARAMPGILPPLSEDEALEITGIHSVAGTITDVRALKTQRPFRAPHHSASGVALIGGGTVPKPGEVSLAHRGVLFLDEFPEFSRSVLENLRQPLEDGIVSISRAAGMGQFPARFMLVAAMNPCPCGHFGDTQRPCTCTPNIIQKYQQRISGPLLDRLDLIVDVPRVPVELLTSAPRSELSVDIQQRVTAARARQRKRYKSEKILVNSELHAGNLRHVCECTPEGDALLKQATERLRLSARSFTRLLKVARTIADLDGAHPITHAHIAEALAFRQRNQFVA